MPTISVVMPFYNRADLVRSTLDSLLAQTFTDFELVCVNDGSTDTVPEILAEYAAQDSRLRIIHKVHTNPGDARNLGYKMSVGTYLCFLDADDLYAPEFLEQMLRAMQTTKVDQVLCGCVNFEHQGGNPVILSEQKVFVQTLARSQFLQQIFSDGCAVWRRLFRRELIERYQLSFQSLDCAEDQSFVFGYTFHCQQIAIVSASFVYHRIHDWRSASNLSNRAITPYNHCLAMLAVRALISATDWELVKSGFERFYLGENCYAAVRANYRQGKAIFKCFRQLVPQAATLKINRGKLQCQRKRRAQKLYQFCLRFNCFWLFYLVKKMSLRWQRMGDFA